MRRRIVTVAALATVGMGFLHGAAAGPAGAAPCRPSDPLCQLLAPIVQPPPAPATSAAPGTTTTVAPAPAVGLPLEGVEAAAGSATAAEVAVASPQVPSVPVGAALELPPLTIPDFGGPPPAAAAPAAKRPVRAELLGDPLPGRPPAEPGGDPAGALAVAVGVPALLVAASVVARRRAGAAGSLAEPAVAPTPTAVTG